MLLLSLIVSGCTVVPFSNLTRPTIQYSTRKVTFESHSRYIIWFSWSLTRVKSRTWHRAEWRSTCLAWWTHSLVCIRNDARAEWFVFTVLCVGTWDSLAIWPFSLCKRRTIVMTRWSGSTYWTGRWQIQFCATQPIIVVEEILFIRAPTSKLRLNRRFWTYGTIHFDTFVVPKYRFKILACT